MSEVPPWSASSSSQSALLHCLSQLNSDTWAEALLPKLVDNGSAGKVALTCAQLRTLCHGSRQQLNLRSLHSHEDPCQVLDWTAGLADRFSCCSCVELSVSKDEDLHGFTYMASALARLPKLRSIKLRVDNNVRPHLPMLPFSTMLYSLHTQLPSLADLTVTCQEGLSRSALPWQELGRATRLTRLAVNFEAVVKKPWPEGHLTTLAGLRNLKVLRVSARGERDAYAPGQWAFMSALTALTQAHLTVASSSDICSLSGCAALEDLAVDSLAASARLQEVQDSVWESIVRLTRLSSLHLYGVAQHAPSPAFAAISSLSRLQHLGVGSWAPAVLPVLQTLPKLTMLTGSWAAGSSDEVTLTGVCSLASCAGPVPIEAFPSLRSFHYAGAITAAAFLAIAEHCTGLGSFKKASEDRYGEVMEICTLAPDEPTERRLAAIQSFTALTSLSSLQLAVIDEEEVAAVAATAAALLGHGCLQSVTIELSSIFAKGGSANNLLLLAKLSGLAELHLHVARCCSGMGVWYSTTEAAFFLSALCGVREVTIMGDEEQCENLSTAQEWLARHGLAGPSKLTVLHVSLSDAWL